MKLWIIGALLLAGTELVQAQAADSSARRYRGGNGPAASAAAARTDRFIDMDGDGICDNRASGLGFRRGGRGMNGSMNAIGGGSTTTGRGKKFQKGQVR